MKTLVDNLKPPIQLYTLGADSVPIPSPVWACGECHKLSLNDGTYKAAEECCRQTYCKCGEKLGKWHILCDNCKEAAHEAKRELVEYDGGPVLDNKRYFMDMDELLDHYCDDEESMPEFVHPCKVESFAGINIHHAMEAATEDLFEDAYDHLILVDELVAFVDQWNKKQTLATWEPQYNKKVKVEKAEAARDQPGHKDSVSSAG
jgi:hypothetical protein